MNQQRRSKKFLNVPSLFSLFTKLYLSNIRYFSSFNIFIKSLHSSFSINHIRHGLILIRCIDAFCLVRMSLDTKSCPSFMTSATGCTAALIIEWMSMLDTCNEHSLSITVPGLVQANVYRVGDTPNRPIMFQNNPQIRKGEANEWFD